MLLQNPYALHNEAYLNLRYQYQSKTSIFFSTVVERQQSQSEVRRPISAFQLRSFEIDALTLKCEDVTQISRFFEVHRGKCSSFRFRDLSNFRLTARPLVTDYDAATGQVTWSQGVLLREPDLSSTQGRVYQYSCVRGIDGVVSCVRKPVFKLASVPQIVNLSSLTSVTPTAIDYNTGIIAMPSNVANFGVSVDFDTPVRFDDDMMEFNISSTNAGFKITTPFAFPNLSPDPGFSAVAPIGYLQEDVVSQAKLGTVKLIEVVP